MIISAGKAINPPPLSHELHRRSAKPQLNFVLQLLTHTLQLTVTIILPLFFTLLEIKKVMAETLHGLAVSFAANSAADNRFPRSEGRWSKERAIRPINE